MKIFFLLLFFFFPLHQKGMNCFFQNLKSPQTISDLSLPQAFSSSPAIQTLIPCRLHPHLQLTLLRQEKNRETKWYGFDGMWYRRIVCLLRLEFFFFRTDCFYFGIFGMIQSLDSNDVDDFEWSDDEDNFLDMKFDSTGNTASSISGNVSMDVSVDISHCFFFVVVLLFVYFKFLYSFLVLRPSNFASLYIVGEIPFCDLWIIFGFGF